MPATSDNGNGYDGKSDISNLIEISDDPPEGITDDMLVAWNNPLDKFKPKVKIPFGSADIVKHNICHILRQKDWKNKDKTDMKRFSRRYYYPWESKHQKDISYGKPRVRKDKPEYDRQKYARTKYIKHATKNMSVTEATQFNEYIKLQHSIMKKCKSMDSLYKGEISGYNSRWDNKGDLKNNLINMMVPMMGNTPKGKLLSTKTDANSIRDSQNEEVQKQFEYLFHKKYKDKSLPSDTPEFWKIALNDRDAFLRGKITPTVSHTTKKRSKTNDMEHTPTLTPTLPPTRPPATTPAPTKLKGSNRYSVLYDDGDEEDLDMAEQKYHLVTRDSSILSKVYAVPSSLERKNRKRKKKPSTTKNNANNKDDVLGVFTVTEENYHVATELINPTNNTINGVDDNSIEEHEDIQSLESMKTQQHIDEINLLTKLSNKIYKELDEYPPRLNWVQHYRNKLQIFCASICSSQAN